MREWSAEVTVGRELARGLIREQFPQLELRSLRLLGEGWDNTVWLVDDEWVFSFPRRSVAVPGIENEIAVLPPLAPQLPLPIPNPTFLGRPSEEFRWPFYGRAFLPGRELADAGLSDEKRRRLAASLADPYRRSTRSNSRSTSRWIRYAARTWRSASPRQRNASKN
jgi:aminoglycoside phosphotransferase (APT) family kinase protein